MEITLEKQMLMQSINHSEQGILAHFNSISVEIDSINRAALVRMGPRMVAQKVQILGFQKMEISFRDASVSVFCQLLKHNAFFNI